jgi:cytochrome c oxidase assembly protein subunit 15
VNPSKASLFLARYAKGVVLCTCILIFLGGLVTSHQAGMAVPDWPLSFGTLDPTGWWANLPVRLEHGHRQAAAFVGLLTTFLSAMIWRSSKPLRLAAIAAPVLSLLLWVAGVSAKTIINIDGALFLIPFAITAFAPSRLQLAELFPEDDGRRKLVRRLALIAFLGIIAQGIMGGLRVTMDTAGNLPTAMTLRILHGCVAQAELCILVTLATVLSPLWVSITKAGLAIPGSLRLHAWATTAAIFLQLIVGATMRHLGAGLAIPSFPAVGANGEWLPARHNLFIDTNFAHTRIGALLVTVLLLALAVRILRLPSPRLRRPAYLALALLALQLTLGVSLIWHFKPPTPTTFHVVNGALLLATSLLLSLRLSRIANEVSPHPASISDDARLSRPVVAA